MTRGAENRFKVLTTMETELASQVEEVNYKVQAKSYEL
jgi:hypothetical protein